MTGKRTSEKGGDYVTIQDEWGTLILKTSARGGTVKWKRVLNGVEFLLHNDRKTQDYLLAFKAGGVQFRLNEMTDRLEVAGDLPLLPKSPEPLSDITEAVVLNWLYDIGFTGQERMLQAITQGAAMRRYHPVREFFEGLSWDGQDHFGRLTQYLRFSPETDIFAQRALRAWMIGAIAKIFRHSQNFMLVIDGRQGIGKSYLVRWLCPLPEFFIEGAIHTEDKDSYKRLISTFIWEVGELEGTTRRSDRAALKDFITRREVTLRLPYGRHDIVKPAAASLVGTINEDGAGFLNDPTGSRRFAVLRLTEVDRAYSTAVDVTQLWAQLYAEYLADPKAGELCDTEAAAQEAINAGYEADSPVLEHLHAQYRWGHTVSGDAFTPSIEILEALKAAGLNGIDRANLMEISTVLRRDGLKKARQNGQHGFYGITHR